jgi:putative alpha-1,2-mannosidase
MEELYTPLTFAGDEDTGSMAAWFILSSMGFFSFCPGKPEYVLGGAFFPEMTVHLPQGKTLKIHAAEGSGKGTVKFNGKAVTAATIGHVELAAGGHLEFS